MSRWRRALAPLAVLWLSCQLTTGAFAFYASDCRCARGTAATCPMHHRTTSGSKTCGMTGLNENDAFVFDAVFSPIGFTTAGLLRAENWRFADRFVARLRFEIDSSWEGELPITRLIDRDGHASTTAGTVDFEKIRAWIRAQRLEQ